MLPRFKMSLLSLTLAAPLLVCGSPYARATEKVTIALGSSPHVGSAPLTFAQELGFFADEGLQLELVVLSGTNIIISQLLNGTITSAVHSVEPLIIARQPGKPNFPYKFVYNLVRNTQWEVATLDSGPIKTLRDLQGKTIGVGAVTWGNVAMTKAALKKSGVDLDSVKFVSVGTGVPAMEALRNGQVDAINLFDTMHLSYEQAGVKLRRLRFPVEFDGVTSHGLPASNKLIKERPDLIERTGRAVAKGTLACTANLEGCVRSYWKYYPSSAPNQGSETEEALKKSVALLQSRLKNMTYFREGAPKLWGSFTDDDWKINSQALFVGGQIETPDVAPDSLYTNQFVDKFNDFKSSEVIERAKKY